MIAWINFVILIVSSFLFTFFYVKSVGPAALEKRIGASAYTKCSTYRMISSIFMCIVAVNYVLYYWFPLPLLSFGLLLSSSTIILFLFFLSHLLVVLVNIPAP